MELNGYETIIALLCLILASLFWFVISLRNEREDFKEKFDRLQNKVGILQQQNDELKINLEESRNEIERLNNELKSAKSRENLDKFEMLRQGSKISELSNKLNQSHEIQRTLLSSIRKLKEENTKLRDANDSLRQQNNAMQNTSMQNVLDLHHINYHEPKNKTDSNLSLNPTVKDFDASMILMANAMSDAERTINKQCRNRSSSSS